MTNLLDLGNILIIGGSRGIGKSIVNNLASYSKQLSFTYKESIDQSLQVIDELGSDNVFCHQLDITSEDSLNALIDTFIKNQTIFNGIVINAGINHPNDFDLIQIEEWDSIINTNLRGPFRLMQKLYQSNSIAEHGSIVLMGSVSGQYGGPRTTHYAASKAGLIALGQNSARFLSSKNIRVNTLSAGLIESEMANEGSLHPSVQKAIDGILLKRFGKQSEVANATHFLLSDLSSYITAQTINVNGGIYF